MGGGFVNNIPPIVPQAQPTQSNPVVIDNQALDVSPQRINSVYPTIQNTTSNREPLDTRNRIAPAPVNFDIKSVDVLENKSKPLVGLVVVAIMLIIIATLSFLNRTFISNFMAGYTGGLYIDIEKTCPVLKNNITKVTLDSKHGQNFAVTNNGELYYLFTTDEKGKLGDCKKITGVSDVQDITVFTYQAIALRLKDNSVGSYTIQLDNGKPTALIRRTETAYGIYQNMPLTAAIILKGKNVVDNNINNYIEIGGDTYFIDKNNNVYDNDLKKIIDGSVFDSAIAPISSYENYLNKQMTFRTDKYIYHFSSEGAFVNKQEKLFGIDANDVNQTYAGNSNERYIMTNDGNFYLFKENSFSLDNLSNSKFAGFSLLNVVVGILIFVITIMIIISYLSENSKFFSGYRKVFGVTLIGSISLSFATKSFSLMPFISTIIYFSFYYIVMRLVWFMLHKINTRSKLLFALIYMLLVSIICLATILIISSVFK